MKKLLSIALFVVTFYSYSQDSKIKYGIQLGSNYSSFRRSNPYNSPSYSESPAFGYLGGVNLEYQIKERLSLKFELNYERKCEAVYVRSDINGSLPNPNDAPSNNGGATATKKYDYLVLPVLLKYYFSENNSFYLNGGPFIGYLLNAKFSDYDVAKRHNKTDFGLTFGIGKNFDLDIKHTLYIEARGNLGLTNIKKDQEYDDETVKTNSGSLIIGYSFN